MSMEQYKDVIDLIDRRRKNVAIEYTGVLHSIIGENNRIISEEMNRQEQGAILAARRRAIVNFFESHKEED